jgi:hypothetical protein
LKILFIGRHFTYFRNFDAAIRELARRGHQLHLAVEVEEKTPNGARAVEALARETPGVTYGMVPGRRADQWSSIALRLRLGLDYLRYLDPFYDTAPLRLIRARTRTPRLLAALATPPLVGGPRWRRWLGRRLHALDAAVPPPQAIIDFLRDQRPDVMLITPLVDLGSQQIDYVRAARLLKIPTGLAVWSWDHLTSKAYLREYPERVFVWNDTQRGEAIDIHGVPPDRVVVTGAQCFDHWFDRTPSRTREAFCRLHGFPVDKPIVLYVGGAFVQGIAPEPPFIEEWIGWMRGSGDPALEGASVLLRPHPQQTAGWHDVDWRQYGHVAVWGSSPVDQRSRDDYFDSLFHSAAVVGINTSAFIEAGIVGRDVLAILVPRFHDTQQGTEHFRYLMQIGGGLLRISSDRETHLRQLGEALRRPPSTGHPHRTFLEAFVRPAGLGRSATPEFVAAVEAMKGIRVDDPVRAAAPWRRAVFGGLVRAASAIAGDRLIRSPRELDPVRQAAVAAAEREQRNKAG